MNREEIRNQVELYYNENFKFAVPEAERLFDKEREHIVNIATSIYCTKHNIGHKGGSFVQAVVNNDLMQAFSTADDINRQVMRFYTMFLYNFSPY